MLTGGLSDRLDEIAENAVNAVCCWAANPHILAGFGGGADAGRWGAHTARHGGGAARRARGADILPRIVRTATRTTDPQRGGSFEM